PPFSAGLTATRMVAVSIGKPSVLSGAQGAAEVNTYPPAGRGGAPLARDCSWKRGTRAASCARDGKNGILKSCAPAGKADCAKRLEAALRHGPPYLREQAAIEGDVVQRQQRRPQHLVRLEQVVQVGPAEVATRVAGTTGLQGG